MIMKKRFYLDWSAFQCTDIAEGKSIKLSRDIGLGFAEAPLARFDGTFSLADTAFHLIIGQFLE